MKFETVVIHFINSNILGRAGPAPANLECLVTLVTLVVNGWLWYRQHTNGMLIT